jgi:hypothetical protein
MISNFNIFDQQEMPPIILCNPNQDKLYSLTSLIYNDTLTLRFNAISEFKFDIPSSIDGGITKLECYDYIQAKRVVFIQGIGNFIISTATENQIGASPTKTVECVSIEAELIAKKITGFSGTYKFYDPFHVTTNIMDIIIAMIPTWTIAYVDANIAAKYRTFDITDETIYEFMMTKLEKAFQCIFKFDIINKTISVFSIAGATQTTDIYLSFNNLIEKSDFKEISNEITTALHVYGGNNLSIRAVNPLGTNTIYNFSYYKTLQWMTQDLINAITDWENLVSSYLSSYGVLLVDLKTLNTEMLDLYSNPTTGLNKLNTDLKVLQATQQAVVVAVPRDDAAIEAAALAISAKEAEIVAQQLLITNKQAAIDAKTASIVVINDALSFENNFTAQELKDLSVFIYENTYTNETIVALDGITPVDYQTASQALYDQAVDVLSKSSQPRYEFNVDTTNFIALKEFQQFTNQLILGCVVTVNVSETSNISTVLLEVQMSYNNPNTFKLTFSNRLRLDGANFQYSDILGQAATASNTVVSSGYAWSDWSANYHDAVSNFITSALDATTNNIINSSDMEMVMNSYGLRGRKLLSPGTYDTKEMWLTNSIMAFTSDNWQHTKVALGEISSSGTNQYGLIAEKVKIIFLKDVKLCL